MRSSGQGRPTSLSEKERKLQETWGGNFLAEGACLVVKGRATCHEPKNKMLGIALPKCVPENTAAMALSPESSSSPKRIPVIS